MTSVGLGPVSSMSSCELLLQCAPDLPSVPAFRNAVEKKTVLENLDLVLLVMDETVDGG